MPVRAAEFAAICLAFGCATAKAPKAEAAPEPAQRLSGIVVDENGAPFWNATVIVRASPEVRRAVATGKDGTFSLAVPFGTYDVVARAGAGLGSAYVWRRDVVVGANAGVSLRLAAQPNPVDSHCRNTPAKLPQKLAGPDPYYTQETALRNIEGRVLLTCIVSVEGVVRGCVPLQSLPPMTDMCIDAVEQRKYSPAVCDGKTIEMDYLFKFEFRLPK